MHTIWKLAAVAMLGAGLSACAGGGSREVYTQMPALKGRNLAEDTGGAPMQCVPYARNNSKVKLYGDAWTWWDKAEGKYPRGSAPQTGAVMVLHDYAGPEHGHLAVVRNMVSSREIRIDHANWLNDGSVFINNPVMDVSQDNNWSMVRVWNIQTGAWGNRIYPVKGFIGSRKDVDDLDQDSRTDRVASTTLDGPSRQLH